MQAIILMTGAEDFPAAEEESKHKALLRIGEKTIIQNQIEQCLELGIERFIFVVGYDRERLCEHILRYLPGREVIFCENRCYREINTLYSLHLVYEYIADEFLIIDGEIFFKEQLLERICSERSNTQLLFKRGACSSSAMKMSVSENSRLLAIGKDIPGDKCTGEFIGIGFFARSDLEIFRTIVEQEIKKGQEKSQFEFAVNILSQQREILAVEAEAGEYLKVTSPEDQKKAFELFL